MDAAIACDFEPIAALVLPRCEMAAALKALNSMQPRWGALVRSQAKNQPDVKALRKGVHVPDARDDSSTALRAIELPAPLDDVFAEELNGCLQGHGGRIPQPLVQLMQCQVAVFHASWQPPRDREDMHPCPEPLADWVEMGRAPLPAHESLEPPGCGNNMDAMAGARPCELAPFRFIELFAGIGGFRVALEALGGRCVFASEFHPTARTVYLENWPCGTEASASDVLAGDIRLIPSDEVADHDLLTAGFPCQPFSTLGRQAGLGENRGLLFLHVCRLLRQKRPAAAVLENVPGLLSANDGEALTSVVRELTCSGYRVAYRVHNSRCVLAQKRKRVYIVAIRGDLDAACERFRFPWLPELGRTLGDVLERPAPQPDELQSLLIPEDRWSRVRNSTAFEEAPDEILGDLGQPAATLISSYGRSGSGQYARYTQLVPMSEGADGVPRRLSILECARLQGFPDGFRRSSCDGPKSWYRLIGNAVSPPVVCAIAAAVVCALQHGERGCRDCRLPGTAVALRLALRAASDEERVRILQRDIDGPAAERVSVQHLLGALEGQGPEM